MSTLSGGTYVEFITRVLLAADAMRRPNKNSHVTWPASLVHLIGACEWEERAFLRCWWYFLKIWSLALYVLEGGVRKSDKSTCF